jgi:5-methylcytosine-specific restriction enzyme A
MKLEHGKVYRRRDLHEHFGGQRQGGISTPSRSEVVLLFTGPTGTTYGYRDAWSEDGHFHYTGEGQVGNMEMVRGNRAIRHDMEHGKSLLLFGRARKGHVRYLWEMRHVPHPLVNGEELASPGRPGQPSYAVAEILEINAGSYAINQIGTLSCNTG